MIFEAPAKHTAGIISVGVPGLKKHFTFALVWFGLVCLLVCWGLFWFGLVSLVYWLACFANCGSSS